MSRPGIELVRKLNPERFAGMSNKMAAIVGCIIGERCTYPALAELVVKSNGRVLGRTEGENGCDESLGSFSDLERD